MMFHNTQNYSVGTCIRDRLAQGLNLKKKSMLGQISDWFMVFESEDLGPVAYIGATIPDLIYYVYLLTKMYVGYAGI